MPKFQRKRKSIRFRGFINRQLFGLFPELHRMLPFPFREQIPLTDIIFSFFDTDRMEKGFPEIGICICIFFCLLQCIEFFICQITQVICPVFRMDTCNLPFIINDHPVF